MAKSATVLFVHSVSPTAAAAVRRRCIFRSASSAVATAAFTHGGDRTGGITSNTFLLCSSSEPLLSSDGSDIFWCWRG